MDKTHSRNRDTTPFVVRVEHADGEVRDYQAAAVIDASGTWSTRNPLGTSGLPAVGEDAAADRISSPLPDVLGRDREAFAGRTAVVVGAGHSAANTLINLAELADQVPGTKIVWAIRGASAAKVYGGGDADGLAARGQLGSRLRALVESGTVELHTGFGIAAPHRGRRRRHADRRRRPDPGGRRRGPGHRLPPGPGHPPGTPAGTGPRRRSAAELGPLIDPEFHSCGTVEPHGARMLAHPEQDFYIVGMKSYGRAPTFLLATGYEQVRSVAAALAGDREARTPSSSNCPRPASAPRTSAPAATSPPPHRQGLSPKPPAAAAGRPNRSSSGSPPDWPTAAPPKTEQLPRFSSTEHTGVLT